jgi:hypothetical protein
MITSSGTRLGIAGLMLALAMGCDAVDPGDRGAVDAADATDAASEGDLLYACPRGKFVCRDPKTGARGACSDHKHDNKNCGACGNVCGKGQSCKSGVCTTPNPCPSGQFICSDAKGGKGACSDHKTDASNCGACGNACLKTQKCTNGVCVTPNPCPGGQFICTDPKGTKGACSDHQADLSNCGACGNACLKTQKCTNGVCVTPNPCPSGQFICQGRDGSAGACSDHKTDLSNCGACGNACQKTQACSNGVCVTPNPCPPGQFICQGKDGRPGACLDHSGDSANCGACGNACMRPTACRNGSCQ